MCGLEEIVHRSQPGGIRFLCKLEHDPFYAYTETPTAAAWVNVLNKHVVDWHGINERILNRPVASTSSEVEEATSNILGKRSASSEIDDVHAEKVPRDDDDDVLYKELNDLCEAFVPQVSAFNEMYTQDNVARVAPSVPDSIEEAEKIGRMKSFIDVLSLRNIADLAFSQELNALRNEYFDEMRKIVPRSQCRSCNANIQNAPITVVKRENEFELIYNICRSTRCIQQITPSQNYAISRIAAMWVCNVCAIPSDRVFLTWGSSKGTVHCSICFGLKHHSKKSSSRRFELVPQAMTTVKPEAIYIVDAEWLNALNVVRVKWAGTVLPQLRNRVKAVKQ